MSRSLTWLFLWTLVHCTLVDSALVNSALVNSAQAHPHHEPHVSSWPDPFRQLEEEWPTPSEVRLASGAPGPEYWQQKVDYRIDVRLDDEHTRLEGLAQITYHNRSPHTLTYLWVQLDQNRFSENSASHLTRTFKGKEKVYYGMLNNAAYIREVQQEVKLHQVSTELDQPLEYTVVGTMMRVDLPKPLAPQSATQLKIRWTAHVLNHSNVWARSGYEDLKPLVELDQKRQELMSKLTEAPGSKLPLGGMGDHPLAGPPLEAAPGASDLQRRIYEVAQWYPRLAAYTDVNGWQNKPFLGQGEFTLEFGDFDVNITVPDTFTVAATGELTNPDEVLLATQKRRLTQARGAQRPLLIITPEEARAQSARPSKGEKTWKFSAKNVRDFAFAASNTYIWDAMGYRSSDGKPVLAMSFYPPESAVLWRRYSTHAVVHTLEVYERHTFAYPYPIAISVNGPIFGMEYPMITFNGVRAELDDTYSKGSKYALIAVIIHEVGHFFFPMIVNSDERQWTWLDEGINSFLQYQAERAWERKFFHWRGDPDGIVDYMTSADHQPIMTNSESLIKMGANAYEKTSVALTILRETIIGPERFDHAFQTYARRWRFKRPMPSDFFRTMEDVSGVDLDWFWRGWFYSTQHVDVRVKDLRRLRLKRHLPHLDKAIERSREEAKAKYIAVIRDEGRAVRVDRYPELADFYNSYDPHTVTPMDEKDAKKKREGILKDHPERARELDSKRVFYELTLVNQGGLVTPVPLRLIFTDGSERERRIPAEIWRKNAQEVKVFLDLEKTLSAVLVDPHRETADAHREDNRFPQTISDVDTIELQKWRSYPPGNPIRRQREYDAQQRKSSSSSSPSKTTPQPATTPH